MYCERHTIALTTNGSGAATGYTPVVSGRVLSVVYAKTDFANTADTTEFFVTNAAECKLVIHVGQDSTP